MIDINLNDPIFKSYLTYVSILVLKTVIMSTWTGITRLRKKVFCSPEDVKAFSKTTARNSVVKYDDEEVERIRRAHLNDLENIPMFIFAGFVYILTKPDEMLAINLFRIFTLFRILYTVVYAVFVIPQPARAVCFNISHLIIIYMIIKSLFTFFYI